MIQKIIAYKNSIYTLLLRIIGVFTLFGFTIYFSNYYPVSIVGEYEFVRMFLLAVGSVCLLGTDISILYFAGQLTKLNRFENIKSLYFNILKIILSISFVPLFLYYFIPEEWINHILGNKNSGQLIKKCLLVLPFNVLLLFNTEMIRAIHHVIWSELFRNIFKFFPIFIGVFLYSSATNQHRVLDFYIYGFVFLAIITFFYIWFFLSKISITGKNIFNRREILSVSVPIAFSSLIFYLLLTIDIVLLRKWFGSEVAGLYAMPVKIILFFNIIVMSINVNVSPKIAELYQEKTEQLQIILRKNAKIIALFNIVVGSFIILFADYILGVFGSPYIAGKNTLYILVVGHLIGSFFGCVAVYLNMSNRSNIFRRIMFVSLIINFLLNIYFIPKYKMEGAAIAFVIANMFWYISTAVYIYKKDKIKIFVH